MRFRRFMLTVMTALFAVFVIGVTSASAAPLPNSGTYRCQQTSPPGGVFLAIASDGTPGDETTLPTPPTVIINGSTYTWDPDDNRYEDSWGNWVTFTPHPVGGGTSGTYKHYQQSAHQTTSGNYSQQF